MTDTAQTVDLSGAEAQLDLLCTKVGFRRVTVLPDAGGQHRAPNGTSLWSSSYARLLLWPCLTTDAATIQAAARDGQAWFDELLTRDEKHARGRSIDGYLVLALSRQPETAVRQEVRHLELSSQVCRKHLIWPTPEQDPDYEPGRWCRVGDVTVVGLPDAEPSASGELQWPDIDSEAQAVWDDLALFGVSETVIRDEAG